MISSTEETKKLIAAKELEVQEAKSTLDSKLETIGNLIHDTVPVSNDEVEIQHSGVFVFLFYFMKYKISFAGK